MILNLLFQWLHSQQVHGREEFRTIDAIVAIGILLGRVLTAAEKGQVSRGLDAACAAGLIARGGDRLQRFKFVSSLNAYIGTLTDTELSDELVKEEITQPAAQVWSELPTEKELRPWLAKALREVFRNRELSALSRGDYLGLAQKACDHFNLDPQLPFKEPESENRLKKMMRRVLKDWVPFELVQAVNENGPRYAVLPKFITEFDRMAQRGYLNAWLEFMVLICNRWDKVPQIEREIVSKVDWFAIHSFETHLLRNSAIQKES